MALEDHPAYQAGYRSGQRFCADVLRQDREGIGQPLPGGMVEVWDLIELAAGGDLPDEVIEQIEERVDPEVQTEFGLGFVAACQDHVTRRDLGLSDN